MQWVSDDIAVLEARDDDPPVRRSADPAPRARTPRPSVPRFIRVEEAARVLAISRSTAYELANAFLATDGREGLPVIRLGTALRVPVRALERWSDVGVYLDDD